jgi:TIR domain
MGNIFISYRREDSGPHAGRIHDRLTARFGEPAIFIDVDDISPGADFVRTLEERLAQCAAALVVIGPRWLTVADTADRRRLDDPADYVRREIETALGRDILVMPVLVGGATMPTERQLPEALAPLARRQAFAIRDDAFHADIERLIESLDGVAADPRIDLAGVWVAHPRTRTGHEYTLRFEFETLDDALFGQVIYPTGSGGILDGTVSGNTVSFRTVHLPQFEQESAEIRFRGKIGNARELELVMQSADGATRVTARPVSGER